MCRRTFSAPANQKGSSKPPMVSTGFVRSDRKIEPFRSRVRGEDGPETAVPAQHSRVTGEWAGAGSGMGLGRSGALTVRQVRARRVEGDGRLARAHDGVVRVPRGLVAGAVVRGVAGRPGAGRRHAAAPKGCPTQRRRVASAPSIMA